MNHDYSAMHAYQQNLCGCTKDFKSCCLVGFIPFCAAHYHSKSVHKSTGLSKGLACVYEVFLCCFGHAINKGMIRHNFGIQGNFIQDCIVGWCCMPCSVCQDYREVKFRRNQIKHHNREYIAEYEPSLEQQQQR